MLKPLFILSLSFVTACGSWFEKPEAEVENIVYGTLTLEKATDTADQKTITLKKRQSCARDLVSGLVQVHLQDPEQLGSLRFNIRGFNSTPTEYTCKQAAGNASGAVGQQYDGCMVSASVPMTSDPSKFNGYSMVREQNTMEDFTYGGECKVNVTEVSDEAFKATVNCTDLVQTHRRSTLRNPLDINTKASITGQVSCTWQ